MWHRHAGLLEFHCVVSTFIWSHLLPLNLFKRLNVSGNETGLSGQITTSKEYHSSPTIEQKKDVYRALFAQFYRLSGIFAHPVGTGSTSNNSRSWIPFLMGSLHIQSEQGPTSNNFRSWTQVLLASLATNSQLFVRYQYQTLWMLATVVSPVLRRTLYIFMYEMMLIKSKNFLR